MPLSVCNSFFNRQGGPLYSYFVKERDRLDKKFKYLLLKQNNILKDIKPIHYVCNVPSANQDLVNNTNLSFSFSHTNNQSQNTSNNNIEIITDPEPYVDYQSTLLQTRDK